MLLHTQGSAEEPPGTLRRMRRRPAARDQQPPEGSGEGRGYAAGSRRRAGGGGEGKARVRGVTRARDLQRCLHSKVINSETKLLKASHWT